MGKKITLRPEHAKIMRERLGMTQFELAQETDLTPSTISRWERGLGRPSKVAVRAFREVYRRHYLDFEKVLEEIIGDNNGGLRTTSKQDQGNQK